MDINKRFIIGIAFLIFVVILWLTGIGSYFDREVLVGSLSFFRSLLATHYYGAAIGYIILYMVCAIVALPVATVLTLTAGFLFGVIPGFCYTILGGTFGALASFLIMRFLFAGFVQHHYGMYLQRFNSAIQHYGYRYLLLIRLVPVIPFFVVNMVASCLPVSVPLFVTTTFFWHHAHYAALLLRRPTIDYHSQHC